MYILIIALSLLGIVSLSIHLIDKRRKGQNDNTNQAVPAEGCCGLHEVCEKYGNMKTKAFTYFDDEELDEFIGRDKASYTSNDIDIFKEIFNSLLESDISAWVESLKIRNIQLPEEIKNDLLKL